jgi:hypothetical protein
MGECDRVGSLYREVTASGGVYSARTVAQAALGSQNRVKFSVVSNLDRRFRHIDRFEFDPFSEARIGRTVSMNLAAHSVISG